jgi:hypothetical protein
MTKLYRLLARAQMHGAVREPGYTFTLAEGERGPHRTIVGTNTGGTAWREFSEPGARRWSHAEDDPVRDEPLYEEVKDEPIREGKPESVKLSPEHERDRWRIADLERELAAKNRQLGDLHGRIAAVSAAVADHMGAEHAG